MDFYWGTAALFLELKTSFFGLKANFSLFELNTFFLRAQHHERYFVAFLQGRTEKQQTQGFAKNPRPESISTSDPLLHSTLLDNSARDGRPAFLLKAPLHNCLTTKSRLQSTASRNFRPRRSPSATKLSF